MTELKMLIENKTQELKVQQNRLQQLKESLTQLAVANNVSPEPHKIIQQHIRKLKEYNELRDTGLRLAQLIAEEKQAKVKAIFDEMGYSMVD